MTGIIDAYWKELKNTVEYYQKQDPALSFDESKYEEFKNTFKQLYKEIKSKYMKPSVAALDRHKVVAVMIITVLKLNIITYEKELKEKYNFLGSEMFATEVALTWMLDSLNKKLEPLGIKEKIESYHMPNAFVCSTPYFEVFSRNLFFSNRDYILNPLDIADKLFLLEYITLIQNGVNPDLLKE